MLDITRSDMPAYYYSRSMSTLYRGWAKTIDLFELVAKADKLNIIGQLPTFVAATLDKMPTVKPEDMDLCLLAKRLSKLEDVVAGHSRSLLESAQQWPPLASSSTDGWANIVRSTPAPVADALKSAADHQFSMTAARPVGRSPLSQSGQPLRSLQGKRAPDSASSGGVRGVPRQLHAFVSRLAAETTDNYLVEWLANVGIQGAVCRKITPKDDRTFKTAAVSVL